MTDRDFVMAHRRFVAAEECGGAASIVIRALDGLNTEKTVPMLASLAWACVATSLQADDLLEEARGAAPPAPRRVLELDVDDLLDFDGEPFPWTDEEGRAS